MSEEFEEHFRRALAMTRVRVRYYIVTGHSIYDTPPPTLWQRIARWWANKTR
jgi:hypothetical protein